MSLSQQPASPQQRLIIISGEEGAGKSTIVRALLPSTPYGADTTNLGVAGTVQRIEGAIPEVYAD